jgi:hypothetical protein
VPRGHVGEQTGVREARLRPEFAELYPGLEPGAWEDATILAEQVLSDRVLATEHFEFRGGDPAGRPPIARTRRTDPAI